MGNGAKAASKRDRAKDKGPKEAKSQLKTNAAAKTFKCKACFQDFQSTIRKEELEKHAADRHKKTYDECFPRRECFII